MASVLSESSSSATTTATISSPVGFEAFHIRPVVGRIREGSYTLGEGPGQEQIRLNRLVAEALHGESSPELRNAELGRAATRALVTIGINQAREKRRRTALARMGVDREEAESINDKEGWESIQDYGNFLRATADTFRADSSMHSSPAPPKTIPSSPENGRRMQKSSQISPIDRRTWEKFRFTTDFSHLAPLTARENRIQAQQSAKLIDWISDSANDGFFRGWDALDQATDAPPSSDEEQQQHQAMEMEALQRILEAGDDPSADAKIQELGWRSADVRGTFAKYLSQEAPPSSSRIDLDPRVTSVEPSWSSSMGRSDEDTRSFVSQDNHWRRTIFG